MADQEVLAEPTHVSATDLYAVLRGAWRALLGTEPPRASLLVLLAQWHFETGGGGQCIAWNLGGVKWTAGCGTDFATYLTREVVNGKAITVTARFRAYPSLDDGVADYLAILRGRFGFAWPAVDRGDVLDFAHRLKLRGYYTDSEESYARGLQTRYALVDQIIGADTDPDLIARLQPSIVQPDPGEPDPPEEPPDAA